MAEKLSGQGHATLVSMLLYAITNRLLLDAGEKPDERERRLRLLELTAAWAVGGVDFIQIREKDLDRAALISLTTAVVECVRGAAGSRTRVLLNVGGPAADEIAAECGVDGLHYPGAMLERRKRGNGLLSVACHLIEDVRTAERLGADLALFAPVFEKRVEQGRGGERVPLLPGRGIDELAQACRLAQKCKVLALGGVTVDNAAACQAAGAAGVAGIRLFLPARDGSDWSAIAR